ncbi:MAG: AAA family ATPase [Deltaproteobacteria bacterium]|nr:AAA family ATPase [Deltaproteobacteria bacterium]
MPPRTRQQARNHKWGRYLKIAGDAGTIAMALRDKPTPLDWLGVALRAFGLGLSVRDERRRAEAGDPWKYFADVTGEEWLEVPDEFRRLVLDHVTGVEVDESYWDGDPQSPFICRGKIGDEVFAWIGEGNGIADGPYLIAARQTEGYRALGEKLWRRLGGKHLLYGTSGLALDPFAAEGVVATTQMRELRDRMRKFVDAGQARSYLLGGPPGTGKSVAIRWLIEQLGLTSVRIDLGVLAKLHGTHSTSLSTSLETLLRLLRPQAMILDDLDRIAVTAPLLSFLEMARRTCVVVIGSANSIAKMMGAAVRPGRFDDIVRVDRLDPVVLQTLLADDADLHGRLAELPAAYVVEFANRRRVLGREQALFELDELLSRSKQIAGSAECDSD